MQHLTTALLKYDTKSYDDYINDILSLYNTNDITQEDLNVSIHKYCRHIDFQSQTA